MRWSFILIFFQFSFLATAVAQASNPQVHISPKPSWIGQYKNYDKRPPSRAINDGYFNALTDFQINVDQKQAYRHFIREIVSGTGIQNGSQISADFDPSYERLDFHEVIVWRDNKPQNRLRIGDFKLLADEQDFSRFIYRGGYSANLILSDIRKGDRIEYSYTITGRNPIFDGKFSRNIYLQNDKIIAHQYISIVASSSRKLNMKFFNKAAKPDITETGGLKRYTWESFQVEPVIDFSNEPAWCNPYDYVQVSEYNSWSDVTSWAYSINQPATNIRGELADVTGALRKKYGADKAGYFREAVRMVQNDVRYMGIEIGEYSHRANRPEKVYAQRYGDCKDKSLLLVSMLKAGGIEAYMTLVNADLNDKIDQFIPTSGAFNHAVVVAIIDGKQVWVDATISNQGGDGTDIYFPDYGKGLILKPGNSELSAIPVSPTGRVVCLETYTVKDENSKVKFDVSTTYTREQADRQRDKIAEASMTETEKSYLDYYSKIYPKIEATDSIRVIDDPHKNVLTMIESYTIGNFYKKDSISGKLTADFYANYISDLLPSLSNQDKNPVSVSYPYAIDYTIKVVLPGGWNITDASNSIDRDAYKFASHYFVSQDTLSLNYQFNYLKDFVAANKLSQFKKDITTLKDNGLGYSIQANMASPPFILNKWLLIAALIFCGGLVVLAVKLYQVETPPIVFTPGSYFVPIGGWLILVMIGLIITPLTALYELGGEHYLSLTKWNALMNGNKSIIFKATLVYETFGYVFIGCYSAFCLVLFWNKRDILPKYIVGYYLAVAGFYVIDYFFALALDSPVDQLESSILRSVIAGGIWISYFKRSTRVEHTFIVPYPHGNYSFEEEAGKV
ncbi:DUF3857 domain-containing protein [Mucilaginibacter sp.]|uniref:DUF3857 domain-containing protein n=1 Tax=Mucilaginibacter sp. TaxID=1882438 RepID=UPI002C688099|nr:DUF3857 domain-containing protein [Mucilaginibacter sp.]HTI57460.1 DUF3857 domain-containing protein [Mucilaginibacter sp.]